MKTEAWIFILNTIFFVLVTPFYWVLTEDWTGTTALGMTIGLVAMVSAYLAYHANHMDARPEDRLDAEIADGAGELGFFPPYSWWPLWCALTLGLMTVAVAFGEWWMFGVGVGVGVITVSGFIYEYYRGIHAH